MDHENPYASPRLDIPAGQWPVIADRSLSDGPRLARNGNLLVFERGAVFPARCVICNQPTEFRLRCNVSWQPMWSSFRQWAKVDLGMCPRHRRERFCRRLLGYVALLVGFVMLPLSIICLPYGPVTSFPGNPVLETTTSVAILLLISVPGFSLYVLGAWFFSVSDVFRVHRIDKRYIRLGKISPEFLATLPELAQVE